MPNLKKYQWQVIWTSIIHRPWRIALWLLKSAAVIYLNVIWHENKNMRTQQTYTYLFVFLAIILMGCIKGKSFRYSEIQKKQIKSFDSGYKEYCNLDLNSNFELNAVQCSFYGDYQKALDQTTRRKSVAPDPFENISYGSGEKADLIKSLEKSLQNHDANEANKASIQKMLFLLKTPAANELFAQAKPVSAVNFVINQAKYYHFTLINEAHFNSQHRSFTQSLLKPLWNQGYRYLALETLSHKDSIIHERGYPIRSTGYYTKDSNFGNLVREALTIGYQLIPYETKNDYDGTLRDRDQTHNIYEQTLKKDKNGKVLIHAGYSHISEAGDKIYEPMGYQLKKKINQDILTIDQVSMIGFNDTTKQHQYYRETAKRFEFVEPTIFLTNEDRVIIDPIKSLGFDIQVYHPETKFENGRPDWMHREGIKSIPLSAELQENYEGHLVQAVKKGEAIEAIPVDQFVISEGKVFLLDPGNYNLRLINCQGDMIATLTLEVN